MKILGWAYRAINYQLLLRSWAAFSALLATVLIILATLSILQHNAVLSDLMRQRLSVVVQSAASSFQTVIDLGLPLSMMRNAGDVLANARSLDPNISAIHVFYPTGIVVHSTETQKPEPFKDKILNAQRFSNHDRWSVEVESQLLSGVSVRDNKGTLIGGILAVYPKNEYNRTTRNNAKRIIAATLMLWIVFSIVALIILRLRLSGAIKGIRMLEHWLHKADPADIPSIEKAEEFGFFESDMRKLQKKLGEADKRFDEIADILDASAPCRHSNNANTQLENSKGLEKVVASLPETSLARAFAKQLVPWNIGIILLATISLGFVTYDSVKNSFKPELERRTDLIAHVANTDIQRAVSAGVPLEQLVGLESYFSDLLSDFPEVSYFGVATGKIIFQAGKWQHSGITNLAGKREVPVFPITNEGENIGYIIIDPNSNHIAMQFREVLLDLAVVIFVALLLANEIMIIAMSLSLTAPLNRLQHLAGLQASGDFTARVISRGSNAVESIVRFLSNRAHQLQVGYEAIGKRLTNHDIKKALLPPKILQFSYLSDIRLPLFLFAAADELPLSFFPIFTRAASNPIVWLDPAVVISLPLAGYLITYTLCAPFSRSLSERWGYRKLLLMALIPVLFSNTGMYFATNVVEIFILRAVAGAGYAFVVLACQDYVIDVVPKDQRTQSMGIFSATLFGGIFAGTALGGVLADRFGASTVFLVSAVMVALSGIIFSRMIAPGRRAAAVIEPPVSLKSITGPFKNNTFLTIVFGLAVPQSVMDQVFISYLFSLQLDALNASAADIGRMLMAYFLMIMLSGSMMGYLQKLKISNPVIAIIGSILTGLALLTAAFVPTQLAMLVAAVGTGFGHGLVRGPQVELAVDLAEEKLAHFGSSSVLGALRLVERGCSVLGLFILASITGYMGLSAAIGAIGYFILFGAGFFGIQYTVNLKKQYAYERRK